MPNQQNQPLTITEDQAYGYLHGVASSSVSYFACALFYKNIWRSRDFSAEVLTALVINAALNNVAGIDRENPALGFVANVLAVEFMALATRGLEYLTGLSPLASLTLFTGVVLAAYLYSFLKLEERAELRR